MDKEQARTGDVLSGGVKMKASEDNVLPVLKMILLANRHTTLMLTISEYHKINKTKK